MPITKKIVYFGTSDFSAAILNKLSSQYKIEIVVTQPDKPSGRRQELSSTPVKITAKNLNLNVCQPQKITNENFLNQLKQIKPDLGILAAYAELIPQPIIDIFAMGILNIHPSLLPKYRGASPVQNAILNLDKITGVTIMKLVKKLDAGPVVAQKECPISLDETNITLHNKLAQISGDLLLEVLPQYLDNKIGLVEQDEQKMTMTYEFKKEDAKINWLNSADQIYAQFRAFLPWPGVFTYYKQKRLKINELSLYNSQNNLPNQPGEVFLGQNSELLVKCASGAVRLDKLQVEGKKPMSPTEIINGYQNFIGTVLS